jgi:hypothetical protein
MQIQARIPPALGAVHNFIRIHDPGEINDFTFEEFYYNGDGEDFGTLAVGPAGPAERLRATAKRDQIAQAMWDDYQRILQERAAIHQ